MAVVEVGFNQGITGSTQGNAVAVAFVDIVPVEVMAVLNGLRRAGLTGRVGGEGGNLRGGWGELRGVAER